MAPNTDIAVELLDAAASRDAGLVERLTALINDVYATAESGLWRDGATRTTAPELAQLIALGQIAVATAPDGHIVGSVHVHPLSDDTNEFGMLVAAPDHRGTGIGRTLLDFAEQHSRDRSMRAIQLELLVPRARRHPSKEFLKSWYSRRGYRLILTRRMNDAHPHLAPLLATPCDLEVHEKPLPAPERDRDVEGAPRRGNSGVGLRARLDPATSSLGAPASDLAFELAEFGPTKIQDELVRFVRAAQRYGADPLLVSIILDRSEPDVTRQRAFGMVHFQVARQIGASGTAGAGGQAAAAPNTQAPTSTRRP